MLLSATMPKDRQMLCNNSMKEPIYVEIEEKNAAIDKTCQERYSVEQ